MTSRGWTGEQLLSLDESSYFDPDLKHAWKPPFAIILNLLQTLAETTGGVTMSFYLILDSDYHIRGANVNIVSSSPNIIVLINQRSYMPAGRMSIPTPGLTFVMSHDLIDSSIAVATSVAAAIYQG